MSNNNFSISFLTDKNLTEVFNAIVNVKGWWTENLDGGSEKLGDEFSVRFGDVHYSKHRLTEVVPGKKIVWLTLDSQLNFIKDKSEWNGSEIVFDIFPKGNKTELRFTQIGLLPSIECYDACSNAWTEYVQVSLKNLIETGKGNPTQREK